MTRGRRVAALVEDSGLVPRTNIVAQDHPGYQAILVLKENRHICVIHAYMDSHAYMQTKTHMQDKSNPTRPRRTLPK